MTDSAKLLRELSRFRAAMDTSGDAIYLVDRTTMRFVDVNQTACTRMGYSREELLRMGPQDLLAQGFEEIERMYDEVIAAGEQGTTVESTARTKDGRLSTTELQRRAMRTEDGWIIVTIARDITERKRFEQALRESEERFRLTFELAGSGIANVDLSGRFTVVNRSLCEILGYPEAELVGKVVKDFSHPDDRDNTDAARARVRRGELDSMRSRKRYLRKDGATVWVDLSVALVRNAKGEPLYEIAVFDDETERVMAAEQILHLANHDSLTGLPNRMLFNDRLGQAIALARREAGQFALLYLDLDKFKPVNDVLGHDAGDRLLKMVGQRICSQVRESDTVARLGGDEFAVILPGVSGKPAVAAVAKKIVVALASPFDLGVPGQAVQIGSSIGIALYPGDAKERDGLLKKADLAMYGAKQAGRMGYRFSDCEPEAAIPPGDESTR